MDTSFALTQKKLPLLLTDQRQAKPANEAAQGDKSTATDTVELTGEKGAEPTGLSGFARKFGRVVWSGLAAGGALYVGGKLMTTALAVGTAAAAAPVLGAGIVGLGLYAAMKSKSSTVSAVAGAAAMGAAGVLAATTGGAGMAGLEATANIAGGLAGGMAVFSTGRLALKAGVEGWHLPDTVVKFDSDVRKKGLGKAIGSLFDPAQNQRSEAEKTRFERNLNLGRW